MKSKVLIPVDTGRNSLTAEEYALKLSWRMPLSITLLTVVNVNRLEGRGISPSDQERIRANMLKKAEATLEAASEAFKQAEVEFQIQVEEGIPGPLICKIAQDEGYDMVIITQSGLSEWEEILGGSVVRTVLNKCPVPVLLVKHTPEQLERQRQMRGQAGLLPG